jgi:phosphopantothenate synthetase
MELLIDEIYADLCHLRHLSLEQKQKEMQQLLYVMRAYVNDRNFEDVLFAIQKYLRETMM